MSYRCLYIEVDIVSPFSGYRGFPCCFPSPSPYFSMRSVAYNRKWRRPLERFPGRSDDDIVNRNRRKKERPDISLDTVIALCISFCVIFPKIKLRFIPTDRCLVNEKTLGEEKPWKVRLSPKTYWLQRFRRSFNSCEDLK
mgnify:CR=1 FL=1